MDLKKRCQLKNKSCCIYLLHETKAICILGRSFPNLKISSNAIFWISNGNFKKGPKICFSSSFVLIEVKKKGIKEVWTLDKWTEKDEIFVRCKSFFKMILDIAKSLFWICHKYFVNKIDHCSTICLGNACILSYKFSENLLIQLIEKLKNYK